jgi:DNA-binding NtrC family response regulator
VSGGVTTDRPRIAVVDDDPAIRFVMSEALADEGYPVATWDGTEDPLAFVTRVEPAVTILDLHLTGWSSGWSVIRALHAVQQMHGLGTAVIVCTADMVFLREHGAELERLSCALLPKPFDLDTLLAEVARCLEPSVRAGRPG